MSLYQRVVLRAISATRRSFGVVASLTLIACSQNQSDSITSAPRQVPVVQALITIPGATALAVVERTYIGGMSQDITFRNQSSTPGENLLRVLKRSKTGFFQQTNIPKLPTSLSDQAARAFPNVRVISEPRFAQNGFGAVGYVTANGTGSDRCIFAQQNNVGASKDTDIRLRFCQPNATDAELLAIIYSLQTRSFQSSASQLWAIEG